MLAQLALDDDTGSLSSNVGIVAVGRPTDQPLLAQVAGEGRCLNVRSAAVARLTEQSLLAELALARVDRIGMFGNIGTKAGGETD